MFAPSTAALLPSVHPVLCASKGDGRVPSLSSLFPLPASFLVRFVLPDCFKGVNSPAAGARKGRDATEPNGQGSCRRKGDNGPASSRSRDTDSYVKLIIPFSAFFCSLSAERCLHGSNQTGSVSLHRLLSKRSRQRGPGGLCQGTQLFPQCLFGRSYTLTHPPTSPFNPIGPSFFLFFLYCVCVCVCVSAN